MDNGTFHTPNGNAKIGPVLEQARKERGLTLEEAEHATKIRKRYLAGLEREDFGVLPDAVYARGFLKTYANYLGLDGEELARELRESRRPRRERGLTYGASPKTSDFDQPLINPGELDRKRGRRTISASTLRNLLVALLLLAAVVGALYYVGAQSATTESAAQKPKPQPPPHQEAAKPHQEAAKPHQEAAKNAQPDHAAPKKAPNENGAPAQPQPDKLSVMVSVEGSASWVSIVADRKLAYEQIAQPGFSQTFEAQHAVSIKTGNAGSVYVKVNGQDLGKLGEYGEVVTRTFTLKSAS